MDKIRTAVIGCGKVGATHALAYKTLPNSELCAVCDVSQKNANQFAKDYNVRAYSDIKKMIRENGVQVVSVC
ncbi:MAG TPA: Gfo/Idh/MocA family oxidoreductase, partial [Flexilinea sp.]|nr:Gfo/Idh/MocA family oxidoreductase [Flexilinea sp.]